MQVALLYYEFKKKTITKVIVFFSYIRLRRVILLCSDIRLKPSDIAPSGSFAGEYNIIKNRPSRKSSDPY